MRANSAVAQIEGHALRGALGEVALQEVEQAAPDGDGDQPDDGDEHRAASAAGARPPSIARRTICGAARLAAETSEQRDERADGLAAIAARDSRARARRRGRLRLGAPARVHVAFARTIASEEFRTRTDMAARALRLRS